ncbi:MAG: hypothetical protein ACRC3B_17440, partial [Bacteroidia bacterium]
MYVNEHPSNSKFLYDSEGNFSPEGMARHCAVLEGELNWLYNSINLRYPYDGNKYSYAEQADWTQLVPPDLTNEQGPYAALVNHFKLGSEERLLLILSISRQINADALKSFAAIAIEDPDLLRKSGCFVTTPNMALVISLNTVLSIIAGNNIILRQLAMNKLVHNSKLDYEQVIEFQDPPNYSHQLGDGEKTPVIAREYALFLQTGKPPRPDFGEGFPAQLISTKLDWDHLIVPEPTMNEVRLAMRWMSHGSAVIERSGGTVNKSFPILFFGPPGTGKSL